MALTFGTPSYKAIIHAVDFYGNAFQHTVELVASSPDIAIANGQRLCNQFNAVTGAKITKLTVKGHVAITGDTTAGYGDWREYQAWIYTHLANSKETIVKIPGPGASLLVSADKRFINPNAANLSLFLARFKSPGNIATLRGSTIASAKTAIIRHVESSKGKKIKIG
jgi:hypothetical protein